MLLGSYPGFRVGDGTAKVVGETAGLGGGPVVGVGEAVDPGKGSDMGMASDREPPVGDALGRGVAVVLDPPDDVMPLQVAPTRATAAANANQLIRLLNVHTSSTLPIETSRAVMQTGAVLFYTL